MNEITPKQTLIIELLAKRERRGDIAPTFREIAAHLKCDVRAAYQHIEALERKGVLRRNGKRRGIELEPQYAPQRGVPVLGHVAAGLPILAEQNIQDYVDLGGAAGDDDVFLLKVRGDSMVDKRIFDGDFVLVRQQMRLEPGEIGVVVVNGESTVKEVHVMRDRVVLVSHNFERKYPDQVYDRRHEIRILGKVIMAFRFIG